MRKQFVVRPIVLLVSNVKCNMAKTNHIDSTRPAPISMNESITVYRLEFLHKFEILYKYFVIQNMEILEALV